jgi:homogentisate 1,2-dioxygenase
VPYKYDLNKYNTIGSISFDHPDPSIFTVLTAQSDDPGQAVCDFVIFPPRWLVMEHTFRPPYYHRNTMTEFMGNIAGTYDAKEKGFIPGAASLHSTMSPHGPEKDVFEKASTVELEPQKVSPDGLAFMFETCFLLKMTPYAMEHDNIDGDYYKCWEGMKNNFRDAIKKTK